MKVNYNRLQGFGIDELIGFGEKGDDAHKGLSRVMKKQDRRGVNQHSRHNKTGQEVR